jgi:uncharacterized protein (TIGR02147 family)
MKSIYEFDDLRLFIQSRIKSGASSVKGVAELLGKDPSMISHFLSGKKQLGDNEIFRVGEFLGLNEQELNYLMALVQYDRATHPKLRDVLKMNLENIRQSHSNSKKASSGLTEEDYAIFYSQWYYSAIRLLTSVPEYQTIDALTKKINLPREKVNGIVDFLVKTGLCNRKANGQLSLGVQYTYIDRNSPYLNRHHVNWRLKSLEEIPKGVPHNYSITAPLTVSRSDADKIRKLVDDLLEKVIKIVDTSSPEELIYLGIDYLKV